MKKIFVFGLLLIISVALLASCRATGNSNNHGNQNGNYNGSEIDGTGIYFPGISINVVVPSGENVDQTLYDQLYSVYTAVCDVTDGYHFYIGDSRESKDNEHEIVLGNTNRDITAKARVKLDRQYARALDESYDSTFLMGYCIYAEGGSVAVVWTDDTIAPYAINYFIENYLNSDTLSLENGYCNFLTLDYLEILRAQEKEQREADFAEIEAVYGAETVEALENYLSLFDDRLYLWLADLYEPGEYDENGNPLGGGFYYSNSGRDTYGYGPDLESTNQVIAFLTSSGMAASKDVMKATLPESFFNEIASFVISCQSPVDGYFYHPQWGTSITVQRRGRDLDWARNLLALCGKSPRWNTPNGVKGTEGNPPGVASASALTLRLCEDKIYAVSKVALTASWTGDSNLSTLKAWEDYLKTFENRIHNEAYVIGNEFAAQASQIVARDNLALTNGELKDTNGDKIADGGYIEMWKSYFDKWQLPNGLWDQYAYENNTITYGSINGLMKISSVYNTLGVKLNRAEKAFEAAIKMSTHIGMSSDGSDWGDSKGSIPSHSVDTYNIFQSLGFVLNNISKFGTMDEVEILKNQIKANATEIIEVTTRKVAMLKKDDGSFGYTWTISPPTSQGAPVAVKDTVEGDVNGGTIATTGIWGSLMGVLEIDLKPFGYSDLLVFANRIKELGPVIKDEDESYSDNPENIVNDFENEDIDAELPEYVLGSFTNGSAEIVFDSNGNNYLALNAVPGTSGNGVAFTAIKTRNPQSLVLEWDMKFEHIGNSLPTAIQIRISSYMLTIGVNTNGTFTLGDGSSTGAGIQNNFGTTLNAYEWNRIRIEFYQLEYGTNETIAYIYINEVLSFISDNYYGKENADTLPDMSYPTARFYGISVADFTLCLDNVKAYQSKTEYVRKEVYNPDRIKHFDDCIVGGEFPVDVSSVGGAIECVPSLNNQNNQAIVIDNVGENVTVSAIPSRLYASCYAATFKIKIDSSVLGEVARVHLARSDVNKSLVAYSLEVYEVENERFARLVEFDKEGNTGNVYSSLKTDEWIEIGFEFYPYFYEADESSIIYVGGEEIGRSNFYFSSSTLAFDYTTLIITAEAGTTIAIDDIVSEIIAKKFVNADGETLKDPDVSFPKSGNWGNGMYYGDDAYSSETKYNYDEITPTKENVIHDSTGDYVIPELKIEEGALTTYGMPFGLKNSGAKVGATYVFETDFFMEGAKSTKTGEQYSAWMGLSASVANKDVHFLSLAIYYTADLSGFVGSVTLKDFPSGTVLAEINTDQWYNLRLEYTASTGGSYSGEVKLYVDGVEVANYTTKGYGNKATVSNESFECFSIHPRSESSSGISPAYRFDNTFMSAYGEKSETQEPGTQEPGTQEPGTQEPGTQEPNPADNRGEGEYFNNTSFGASAKYDYNNITPTKENVIHSSTADYVLNPTFLEVKEGVLAAKGAAFGLNNGGSKNGTTYVFETDFFMEGTTSTKTGTQTAAWMGISATDRKKDTFFLGYSINYTADEDGFVNEITLNEYKSGTALTTISTDQWYNLRFEYTPVEGDTYSGQVKLYVNDVEVKSYKTGSGYAAISNESFECFGFEIRGESSSGISTTYMFDNTFMSAITEE